MLSVYKLCKGEGLLKQKSRSCILNWQLSNFGQNKQQIPVIPRPFWWSKTKCWPIPNIKDILILLRYAKLTAVMTEGKKKDIAVLHSQIKSSLWLVATWSQNQDHVRSIYSTSVIFFIFVAYVSHIFMFRLSLIFLSSLKSKVDYIGLLKALRVFFSFFIIADPLPTRNPMTFYSTSKVLIRNPVQTVPQLEE